MNENQYAEQLQPELDIRAIAEEFHWCVDQKDTRVFTRMKHNVEARLCWWQGQTVDGRRWAKRGNDKDVFPWRGAADTRPHLTDLYVRADAAMLMTVWRNNKIQVSGTEVSDDAWAKRMTGVMRWLRYRQMREYKSEARLLANLFLERGAAVMGAWWVRQNQLGNEIVTADDVLGLQMQGQLAVAKKIPQPLYPGIQNAQLAELQAIVADPLREKEAMAIAAVLWPDVDKSHLSAALAELRDSGTATIVRPYLIKNRPKVCALALNEDIFLPPECTEIDEECSSVHMLEVVSAQTIRERVQSMGWDEGWAEYVIKTQRGSLVAGGAGTTRRRLNSTGSTVTSGQDIGVNYSRVFEIVHSYTRQSDKRGVPQIVCTTWHPGLLTKVSGKSSTKCQHYAVSEPLDYQHGQMPFTLFRREMRTRNPDDSRGYGQITSTWQDCIKAEFDGTRDANSLRNVPPSFHPPGDEPEEWGPGAQIGTVMPERYGFFPGPQWNGSSREIRQEVMDLSDRYMGRLVKDGANRQEAMALQQDLADTWMEGFEKVDTQILQLAQQYLPNQFVIRLVGTEQGRSMQMSRDDIQGEFDLSIKYNMADMDPELLQERVTLFKETLMMDRNGRLDPDAMIQAIYDIADPNLGERVIRPAGAGLDAEINDEADVFSKMFAGVFTNVKQGQAFQPRLEWLQNQLKTNATAISKIKQDPNFAQLVEKRMQQLSFQLQQHTINADIGRNGA